MHIEENFGDLLDPRFQKIFSDQYDDLPDMIPEMYPILPHNNRETWSVSDVGTMGDWDEFDGEVTEDEVTQGYDVTATYIEYTKGFKVERKLFDDDQFNIMDQKPRGMAMAAVRTRQRHAARLWSNAFAVDSYFYSHSEGVALCANAHTTNADSVDTSVGFDNLVTSALSATALTAARNQMVEYRDDRGNFIPVVPDEIVIPHNLYDVAYEIVASMGKVDSSQNNRNVHYGAYNIIEWMYLSDTNNWFLQDSAMRKQSIAWIDRIEKEFAYVEDFDTLVSKWRGYMRYVALWWNWRWILGALVS